MDDKTVEITPAEGVIKVGCEISILPKSVTETKRAKVSYGIIENGIPDGFVRASETVSFSPPVRMKKYARTQIPTWFIAKEGVEVDVCVFAKLQNSTWEKVEDASLTDEGFVDTRLKELNNVTVLLNKKFLSDVKIAVKSYLFCNKNSSFKTVTGLNVQHLEKMLIEEMSKKNYKLVVEPTKEIRVSVGDEILYKLCRPDKHCDAMRKGKCTIDESFITTFNGHVEEYDVCAVPTELLYQLRHRNVEAEMMEVDLAEFRVVVPSNQTAAANSETDIQFHGDTTIGSMISNVRNAHINQTIEVGRNTRSAAGIRRTTPTIQINTATNSPAVAARTDPGLTVTSGNRGSRPRTQIRFLGDTKIGTMVSNADNVVLNQRMIHGEPAARNQNQPERAPEMAENDLPQPMQVGDEAVSEQDEEELTDHTIVRDRAFSDPNEDPR